MQFTMICNTQQFKILDTVIKFIMILVMYIFLFCKRSIKILFHYKSMLIDAFSSDINNSVTIFRYCSSFVVPNLFTNDVLRMPNSFTLSRTSNSSLPFFFRTGEDFNKNAFANQARFLKYHICVCYIKIMYYTNYLQCTNSVIIKNR